MTLDEQHPAHEDNLPEFGEAFARQFSTYVYAQAHDLGKQSMAWMKSQALTPGQTVEDAVRVRQVALAHTFLTVCLVSDTDPIELLVDVINASAEGHFKKALMH